MTLVNRQSFAPFAPEATGGVVPGDQAPSTKNSQGDGRTNGVWLAQQQQQLTSEQQQQQQEQQQQQSQQM